MRRNFLKYFSLTIFSSLILPLNSLFANTKKIMVVILAVGMLCLNTYLGILDYRVWFYTACLIVFCCLGYFLKNYETIPLIFLFILGNDIEGVFYRQWLI